jgi:hypothetical protein
VAAVVPAGKKIAACREPSLSVWRCRVRPARPKSGLKLMVVTRERLDQHNVGKRVNSCHLSERTLRK